MKLKEIIKTALTILKRDDILDSWAADSLTDEQFEVVKLLLFCVNSVEDELARHHFPLRHREEVETKDGIILFTDLTYRPSRFFNTFKDGEPIRFQLFPTYIMVRTKKVEIEYEYVPAKSGDFESESSYSGTCVSENIIAAGAVSEFYIISGDIELSEYWESRYRKLIDGARRIYRFCRKIPTRRWI